MVDVLHGPKKPFMPTLQVELRSKIPRLMDLETIVRHVSRIEDELGCGLFVREIELTIDLPTRIMGDRRLRELACFRRPRNTIHWRQRRPEEMFDTTCSTDAIPNEVMCGTTSSTYGARNAARLFRIYRKSENGFTVTRFECRLRGSALAELGVTDAPSLLRMRWSDVLAAEFGMLQFAPPTGSEFQGVSAQVDRDLIRVRGLHATMRNATPARRRFLERYLAPHPIAVRLIGRLRATLDPPRSRKRAI